MKLIIFFSLFFSSVSIASEASFKMGEESFSLHKIDDQGFVSKGCVGECELKEVIKRNLGKLSGLKITGGKNPASVLCKIIKGKVVFMEKDDVEETFCLYKDDIISLSLLLP